MEAREEKKGEGMKTISFQVTDDEYEQARLIVRECFGCCPGFDVSALARAGHLDWCRAMMEKVARKRASEDTAQVLGTNVVPGPWKLPSRGDKNSQPTPENR
jgi:hypothetical protein